MLKKTNAPLSGAFVLPDPILGCWRFSQLAWHGGDVGGLLYRRRDRLIELRIGYGDGGLNRCRRAGFRAGVRRFRLRHELEPADVVGALFDPGFSLGLAQRL